MEDPAAHAAMVAERRRFKSGDYDKRFVSWIGQTLHAPGYWPWEQIACYCRVVGGLVLGEFAKVQIIVGATPGPDADREGNAAKLRGTHPAFRAHLDMQQNGAEGDGTLSWGDPIGVEKSVGVPFIADCGKNSVIIEHPVAPASVPLEVGYTKPSRTLLHLKKFGGVARWAYDDDRICLLINTETLGRWGRMDRWADEQRKKDTAA
ncbi:hypothetical protein [Streptomyces jeddahensis]|uniref:Uncharacterized protein n=1 Tax=Streptomyces jeddahensis TaxID=1716141 RepID=A0A177HIX8_9ACTN|nr:hypothetical protein [Streptomyces jeddahensis]OAH10875.1 hypothetical protein STSP_57170 [Streptomyces jeddahensis]